MCTIHFFNIGNTGLSQHPYIFFCLKMDKAIFNKKCGASLKTVHFVSMQSGIYRNH